MANLKYFLWLTTRPGFQPGDAWSLLQRFGTPEAVYYAEPAEYELAGLPAGKREALADKSLDRAEEILAACDRLGQRILTIQDADYPERLAQIHDPPCVLYLEGKPLHVDTALTVAVVGTRRATPLGTELAGRLALELARNDVTLVSGTAAGIDAAAVRGALQGGGTVVSVTGGGLDQPYPAAHRWLYDDVAASGTLVSEYPPGTENAGEHFPVRNRILSGLSLGVVVVEAPLRSGALITARHALDQNREVFAFPGGVDAPNSLGPNLLIQRGEAKLILSADDVLEEFSAYFPARPEPVEPLGERETAQRLRRPKGTPPAERSEKEVDKVPGRAYISLSDDPEAFTDDERDILRAIERRSLTADELVEAVGIPIRRVSTALTMLQLRGMVEAQPGKRYYAAVILRE